MYCIHLSQDFLIVELIIIFFTQERVHFSYDYYFGYCHYDGDDDSDDDYLSNTQNPHTK